jgi:3',5'-cyclic AMP phosphodiesterase CpdA
MIPPPNGNSAKTQNDLTSLSIAIASDLHCHHKPDGETQESFLLIGSPRVPPGGHPIQSLIELAKKFHLQADVLICPGDVANRAQREGLSTGMDFLLELKRGLNCSSLMCTLGNHDVNSGKKESSDPFELPRMIHPSFPL